MKKNNLEFYDISADDWWNEDAKIYNLYHLNKPRFEFFSRYISNWQEIKALDVGCGGGFSCEYMADLGVEVYGIDRSQKCIETAINHANFSGFEISYCCGVAEKMPYPNDFFDVVVCVDVLEHVESVPCVVSEIFRILKPNGLFFFDTINRNFKSKLVMIWLMENILGEIPKGVHDWQKFIKPEEITEVLNKSGFDNITIKGFDIFSEALQLNLVKYLQFKKTNTFVVDINDDTSINYIGKASKVTDTA